jgi:hypothetical protein
MELISHSPAIVGLRRKALYSGSDERRAMCLALTAACGLGNNFNLPVIYGNRIIGRVRKTLDGSLWAASSLDQLINAETVLGQALTQSFSKLQNNTNLTIGAWYDHFTVGPDGESYSGAALTSRQFTDTSHGCIPHGGNVSPLIKLVTGAYALSPLCSGVWLLYDRVLDYESCTINGATQAMVNSVAAQRYIAAGQPGLSIMCTMQAPTGGAFNLSGLTYVNQNGLSHTVPTSTTLVGDTTAVVTPSNFDPTQSAIRYNSTAGGNLLYLPLATGDSGAQSITNFTTSAAQTGSLCFTLAYPLAILPIPAPGNGGESDWLRQTVLMKRIYDGASLFWNILVSTNQSSFFGGHINFVWS